MEEFIKKGTIWWVYLAGMGLLAIILVTVYNIATAALSNFFGLNIMGIAGYEDFIALSMSSIALMFFPYTQYKRGHVAVDFFADMLSTRTQIMLDKVWLTVTFFLIVFLAYYMYLGMIESYEDEALSRILGWPQWPFYIPGVISLVMWGYVLIYQVVFKKDAHHG